MQDSCEQVRRFAPFLHYLTVTTRTLHLISPDHWLLVAWKLEPAVSRVRLRKMAAAIRQGCQLQHYWLRAYAALPDRIALLLYPLEDATHLLANLRATIGRDPDRLREIRDDADLERAARFVEALPVRSHLAERPQDYPWSSIGWLYDRGHSAATAAAGSTPPRS